MKKSNNRTENGRFSKGVSGNPSGRPLGSRNKATLLMEELLDEGGADIVRKTQRLALQGNIQAVRMILDRILPARKDRSIQLELKPVQSLRDIPGAYDSILAAIAEGRITPSDGRALSEIVSKQAAALQDARREQRILEPQLPVGLFHNGAESNDSPPNNGRNSENESTPTP